MNAEEIFKLLREGSKDAMEGLEILEALSKNLSAMALDLSAAAQQGKRLVEVADRISKKIPQRK